MYQPRHASILSKAYKAKKNEPIFKPFALLVAFENFSVLCHDFRKILSYLFVSCLPECETTARSKVYIYIYLHARGRNFEDIGTKF